MNPIHHIRRLAAALAGLAGALLACAAAAPAALAGRVPPLPPPGSGSYKHPPLPRGHVHYLVHQGGGLVPVRTVVIGGMPGWQIALIAIAAALLAATAAVLAYRARTTRRGPVSAAA